MKFLWVLGLLIICFGGFVTNNYAQPCAGFTVNVFVQDESFKSVENANVEAIQLLADGKSKVFTKSDDFSKDYYELTFGLPKLGEYFKEEFLLRVSAEGFKTGEMKVRFTDCAKRVFEFILKPQNSQSPSETAEFELLMGKVKDENGNTISNAKVRAKSISGRIYEAKTDTDGNYRINLPTGVYKIEIEANKKVYERGETTITSENGVNFLDLKL